MSAVEKRVEQMGLAPVDTIPMLAVASRPALADLVPHLLQVAIERGMDVTGINGLVDLQIRVLEYDARAAFFGALSAFRDRCPPIPKTRENSQYKVTRDGVSRSAKYAPLEDIDRIARPVAASFGLAWTWDTRVEGDLMHITCRLTHVMGHSQNTNVSMPYESKAGSSPQQKFGGTQQYGMRYSLIAALGLTTTDEDVDGNAPKGEAEAETLITLEQAKEIERLIEESGSSVVRFLKHFKVDSVAALPARWYDQTVSELKSRVEQRRAQ